LKLNSPINEAPTIRKTKKSHFIEGKLTLYECNSIDLVWIPHIKVSITNTATEVFFNKINPDVENTFIVYQQGEIIDKYVNLSPTPDKYKRKVRSVENTMKEFLNIKAPRHQ
jgi:protocatechuate 3,4-dioxygenase beta subunit